MHVLVIHIGPVQEFIESARKCRDLWFSSWILSELARAVAKAVVLAEGREENEVLAFPGARTSDPDRSVANKIVALVSKLPADIASAAERGKRARLDDIRERAFGRVAPRHPRRRALFHEDVAKQQVDDAFELLWAAAPLGAAGYKAALDEAERLLGAVKSTRRWEQPPWAKQGDGVPKSSLDGLRESVLDEALYKHPRRLVETPAPSPERLRRDFGVHGAERLCGVGVLKRFGNRDPGGAGSPELIFSTLHVASGPFRAGLAAIGAGSAWAEYRDRLQKIEPDLVVQLDVVPSVDGLTGRFDGAIFYEARLCESLEELGVEDASKATASTEALRDFLRRVRPELGDPVPYYAILLGDGDRMGKIIDSISDFKEHRRLSEELEAFASSTRGLVQACDGALIYAGGDDVLALLPLHQALRCAVDLAGRFASAMQDWKIREGDAERSPTLSVGMAVVHQMLPLDEALALARSTEKRAKSVPGKNALTLVVKKRGGEAVYVEGPWGAIDKRLRTLIRLHHQDAISTKAQYELMDLAERLDDKDPRLAPALAEVRLAEAKRLLARKREGGGGSPLDEATRNELDRLGAFDDPARLGRELYVAQLFAQAERQAKMCVQSPSASALSAAPEVPR